MLIYFGAPLFCEAEKAFNLRLTDKLEERGFRVFLPQRDGVEIRQPPYVEMTSDELRQAIFSLDRDKVLEADIFLFILDGRVPDEGACVELGIAYGQKHLLNHDKLIIGLQTDSRSAFLWTKLNAMVYGSFEYIADNENNLIAAIEEYRQVRMEGVEPA
jgi:nucleoside 2-deoxyribosyltransferase